MLTTKREEGSRENRRTKEDIDQDKIPNSIDRGHKCSNSLGREKPPICK
jgi:hypothetical protein